MASNYMPMPAPSSGNRGGASPITRTDRQSSRPVPHKQPRAMSVFRQPGSQQPPAGIRKPSPDQKSQARRNAIQNMRNAQDQVRARNYSGTKGNGVNPDQLAPVQQRRQGNSGKKAF